MFGVGVWWWFGMTRPFYLSKMFWKALSESNAKDDFFGVLAVLQHTWLDNSGLDRLGSGFASTTSPRGVPEPAWESQGWWWLAPYFGIRPLQGRSWNKTPNGGADLFLFVGCHNPKKIHAGTAVDRSQLWLSESSRSPGRPQGQNKRRGLQGHENRTTIGMWKVQIVQPGARLGEQPRSSQEGPQLGGAASQQRLSSPKLVIQSINF